MLGEKNAIPTIAVKDLTTAKEFYADTLGLKAVGGRRTGSGRVHEWEIDRACISFAVRRNE